MPIADIFVLYLLEEVEKLAKSRKTKSKKWRYNLCEMRKPSEQEDAQITPKTVKKPALIIAVIKI